MKEIVDEMVSYKNLLSSEEKCLTGRVFSLYIGICRDDTRRPGVSTLFSYLHLIDFETLIIFNYKVILLLQVVGDR